jgi:hypothetical protein
MGGNGPSVPPLHHQEGQGAHNALESSNGSQNLAGNEANVASVATSAPSVLLHSPPLANVPVNLDKKPAAKRKHGAISATAMGEFFPPTIFTDAIYSRGIRTAHADSGKVPANYIQRDAGQLSRLLSKEDVEAYHYKDNECPRKPSLTQTESKLWSHTDAARCAAQMHFPAETGRLLGVITRHFTETCCEFKPPLNAPTRKKSNKAKLGEFKGKVVESKPPTVSKARGMQQARADATRHGVHLNAGRLEVEAAQNKIDWANALKRGVIGPGWDENGELYAETVNDPDYITCSRLLKLFQSDLLFDDHAGEHKSLYNGLRSIPTDTVTVLMSLLELCSPAGLYEIPLISPYATMQLVSTLPVDSTSQITRQYKVQIGVYCNRLLFEVMTQHDLHIVMSALDEGSYRVTQPIHLPPMSMAAEPAFCSCPCPTVVVDDDENNSDDSDNESTENGNGKDDVHMMSSTRDESTVSAFTPRGLLKLLESEGNDISNWPDISKVIEPSLKVELMLHQIHGVCWMVQMEHLEGFGLNSLVWEEREFFDGGKWYYSPAVGQARLSLGGTLEKPPVMKGGILSDEMGLGYVKKISNESG